MEFNLQILTHRTQAIPSQLTINKWVHQTLALTGEVVDELTVRVVDKDEITQLNQRYRNKCEPTNVLSFALDPPTQTGLHLLADIVVCAEVVECEAKQQDKPLSAHWAHMIVHSVLHLCGYDHKNDNGMIHMQNFERKILLQLGFSDPYQNGREKG